MLVPLSYNLRSLFVRRSLTLLTVLGIGATVAPVAGVLSLQQGFQTMYDETGREDVAVVLRNRTGQMKALQLSLEVVERDGKRAERTRFYDLAMAPRQERAFEMPAIGRELKTEPKRIEASYEVKATRVEPVGVAYLWPVSRSGSRRPKPS